MDSPTQIAYWERYPDVRARTVALLVNEQRCPRVTRETLIREFPEVNVLPGLALVCRFRSDMTSGKRSAERGGEWVPLKARVRPEISEEKVKAILDELSTKRLKGKSPLSLRFKEQRTKRQRKDAPDRATLTPLPERITEATYQDLVHCRIKGVERLSRPACFTRQLLRVRWGVNSNVAHYLAEDHESQLPKFLVCRAKIDGAMCPEFLPQYLVVLLDAHIKAGFEFRLGAPRFDVKAFLERRNVI